ncbi:MAG: peptidase M48 [Chlamydiae bacterium]|nr:peptidase M48 [Chlamydiota bacterium]
MPKKKICITTGLTFLVFGLIGCGVNPVTGKNELQFVSESQEIEIGQQYYPYLVQAEGGVYSANNSINEYVANVGRKLARVSDRPHLPYEFTVLDNSIPNAWALPGGKISINIGLLVNLENEAELAAVLGHEIVHSAARHGAQAMQRAAFLQTGMVGLSTAVAGSNYEGAVMQGANIGVGLITSKYSRSAELEADKYGIKYMEKAGYNPEAAVTLQEMFVKLEKERNTSWMEGLFATHPPSEERVKANEISTKEYPEGGYLGENEYKEAIAQLIKNKPAYEAMEKGYRLLYIGGYAGALEQAQIAIKIEPREGHFYNLQGKAQIALGRYRQALSSFDTAINRNPNYFEYYLQRGLLKKKLNMNGKPDLQKSFELLPTQEAYDALGYVQAKPKR